MRESTDKIAELIRQGRKVEAIKLLREQAGIRLKEAKERVETGTGPGSGWFPYMAVLDSRIRGNDLIL